MPIPFPAAWISESILDDPSSKFFDPRDEVFRRAIAVGLDGLPLAERRGHLPAVTGKVAEAVATRILDEHGFSLFSQLIEDGAHGVDLMFLTPAGNVLVLEVKGTLREGTIPRLGRSRLKQMSAAWLDGANAPMLEWGLQAADVYGAVMVVDLVARHARVAVTKDNAWFWAVETSRLDAWLEPSWPPPRWTPTHGHAHEKPAPAAATLYSGREDIPQRFDTKAPGLRSGARFFRNSTF